MGDLFLTIMPLFMILALIFTLLNKKKASVIVISMSLFCFFCAIVVSNDTNSYDNDTYYSGFEYENCSEVRSAGAAPIYEGEPGFGHHLDRDGDGVGCEPWHY